MLKLEEKSPIKNTALGKTPQCVLYSSFIWKISDKKNLVKYNIQTIKIHFYLSET